MKLRHRLSRALSLLDSESKRKFRFATIVQASLGILDVVGVMLWGSIAAIASTTYFGLEQPPIVANLMKFLNLSEFNIEAIVLLLIMLSLTLFMTKTLLALYFSRKTFRFLSIQQSKMARNLFSRVVRSDYSWFREQNPHSISQTLVRGISAATTNELGNILLMSGEIALISLFIIFLTLTEPFIAVFMVAYLCAVMFSLNVLVGDKVSKYHLSLAELDLNSQVNLFNSLRLYREVRVMNREGWFEKNSDTILSDQAQNYADDAWIQQLPKYILEVASIVGAVALLGISAFVTNDNLLIPILAIYIAGSARIFPAVLRIQSCLVSLRSHSALADQAHNLLKNLDDNSNACYRRDKTLLNSVKQNNIDELPRRLGEINVSRTNNATNDAKIRISRMTFQYPKSDRVVLDKLNLEINEGERVAIVGPSGAGKSTLCDLLLGLLQPTSGEITIGENLASEWIRDNIGSISYLPQETTLIGGSILENICIGLSHSEVNEEKLRLALERAQLFPLLSTVPSGLDSDVGVDGTNLSGGQRQRIGIARALYSSPRILIFDEATSSLDAETEQEVMNVLESLGEKITVVFIAHRLSSIRRFARVIYLDNGTVLADSSFAEVRKLVPAFDKQVRLSGILDHNGEVVVNS